MLLENNALPSPTIMGNTPVDIAGFTKQTDVVLIFCRHLEQQMIEEKKRAMAGGQTNDEETGLGAGSRRGNAVRIAPLGSMESNQLRRDLETELKKNADGTKTVIECRKVERHELDFEESI